MILAYPVDENKMRILDGKCKKEGAEAPSQIAVYGALPCGIFSPQAKDIAVGFAAGACFIIDMTGCADMHIPLTAAYHGAGGILLAAAATRCCPHRVQTATQGVTMR